MRAGHNGRVPYLSLVTLLVRDYDEAIDFFVDALGFDLVVDTARNDGSRWVVVRPSGPGESGLLLGRAATDEQRARVGDQTGGRVGFVLATDDFAGAHRRMLAHRVEFEEEPRLESYGTVAVFRDLYGNRWDLLQGA